MSHEMSSEFKSQAIKLSQLEQCCDATPEDNECRKYEEFKQHCDANPEDNECRVYGDFKSQSKKISQIIAKSWLPNDPEGMEIKRVIFKRNSNEIKNLLKKYGIDFEGFFGPTKVVVDWSSYKGIITEDVGELVYILPYPPRPTEVTNEQLEEWVNNNDPDTLYPTTPYIPLTVC